MFRQSLFSETDSGKYMKQRSKEKKIIESEIFLGLYSAWQIKNGSIFTVVLWFSNVFS